MSGTGGKRSMPTHPSMTPAKKQSKWTPEEDALIIDLRGSGMKWEDISRRLPGRSSISCRLHYQNYLERRSEWNEEKKSKLARLYERLKPEMWTKIAEEMQVPWRAAEAMHWQLGEADMARRAGVVPFSLSSVAVDPPLSSSRPPSHRGHSHSHSHSATNVPTLASLGPSPRYHRDGPATRSIAARREMMTRPALSSAPSDYAYSRMESGAPMTMATSGPPPMLPSVAEMTTGVSPYSTPAYSNIPASAGGRNGTSPPSYMPSASYYPPRTSQMTTEGKRTRSPEKDYRETRRRQGR